MDYVTEFYCIYCIIVTYDIRKSVFLSIGYVCNKCCCSKKYCYFGPIKGLALHAYILPTFLFFSENVHTSSNKSVKIYGTTGL